MLISKKTLILLLLFIHTTLQASNERIVQGTEEAVRGIETLQHIAMSSCQSNSLRPIQGSLTECKSTSRVENITLLPNTQQIEEKEAVQGETNLLVTLRRFSDWDSGFCSNVNIYNPSDVAIAWSIDFEAGGYVYDLWNADYSQDSSTYRVEASGVAWNSIVASKESVTIGYCANKVADLTPPSSAVGEVSSGLIISETLNSQWNEGYCHNVYIFNPTNETIRWEVEFDVVGEVYNIWNASYTQSANKIKVNAYSVDWNEYVDANTQVEFGYCANYLTSTPEQIALQSDVDALTFDTIRLDNTLQTEIRTALTLPSIASEGSLIVWESDNNSTISIVGEVTRAEQGGADKSVRLTATLSQGSEESQKSFDLIVVALEKSDREIVADDNATLSFDTIRLANTRADRIQSNLYLPTRGQNGSLISWVSTNESNISNSGQVKRPAYGEDNVSVILTATIESGIEVTTQEFVLQVIAYQSEQESSPYATVLPLALKFYEAQRASGPFPTVTWRKAGGEDDGDDVGRDLSGGWFDAGDHVKFNLPMSYSVAMLNWGLVAFESAYSRVGERVYAQEQVKYALDYLLAAYNSGVDESDPSDDIVYYQVADGDLDHSFWGPPEAMSMSRPTFSCDSLHRCSEVAGGMAAAMASGSIALRDYDSSYADQLLDRAKKLYNFATIYEGNNGYTAANSFYRSYSGYNDELSWAAIWLYIATNESKYLNDAKTYVAKSGDSIYWSQNWDNVSNGTLLLLATITGESSYQESIENHFNYWLHNISYSSGGLAFLSEWGSLRYSSTTAFMALLYAEELPIGEKRSELISFAKDQIDYILGVNPRNSSYVVGYGNNSPINPHHRAAHNSPSNDINAPSNNEFLLEGALVGGPKSINDMDYADDRRDHIANEVATDYNAGFTGALVGLIELLE